MARAMAVNPKLFLEQCLDLTPIKAIEQGTQLSVMKKDPDCRKHLHRLIEHVQYFYGVKDTMNDVQIAESIGLLLKRFWYMKFEEIVYCFTNAKSGRYGTLFQAGTPNRMHFDTLAHWLNEYDKSERQAAIEQARMAEHGRNKGLNSPLEGNIYEDYLKNGPQIQQDRRLEKQEQKAKDLLGMRDAMSKYIADKIIKQNQPQDDE